MYAVGDSDLFRLFRFKPPCHSNLLIDLILKWPHPFAHLYPSMSILLCHYIFSIRRANIDCMASTECYPERSPKIDCLLETLSDNLRREVIHYFENHTDADSANIAELVNHIDKRVPNKDGQEVRMVLHHQHLPWLHERGWLEYDTRHNDIHYSGRVSAEELLTELVDVFSDRRPT